MLKLFEVFIPILTPISIPAAAEYEKVLVHVVLPAVMLQPPMLFPFVKSSAIT
jgi:hypothetical protein